MGRGVPLGARQCEEDADDASCAPDDEGFREGEAAFDGRGPQNGGGREVATQVRRGLHRKGRGARTLGQRCREPVPPRVVEELLGRNRPGVYIEYRGRRRTGEPSRRRAHGWRRAAGIGRHRVSSREEGRIGGVQGNGAESRPGRAECRTCQTREGDWRSFWKQPAHKRWKREDPRGEAPAQGGRGRGPRTRRARGARGRRGAGARDSREGRRGQQADDPRHWARSGVRACRQADGIPGVRRVAAEERAQRHRQELEQVRRAERDGSRAEGGAGQEGQSGEAGSEGTRSLRAEAGRKPAGTGRRYAGTARADQEGGRGGNETSCPRNGRRGKSRQNRTCYHSKRGRRDCAARDREARGQERRTAHCRHPSWRRIRVSRP